MNWDKALKSELPPVLPQDNTNINEAANFLVKHIMATEHDILKSVVPDTISPQLGSHSESLCSGCFKP